MIRKSVRAQSLQSMLWIKVTKVTSKFFVDVIVAIIVCGLLCVIIADRLVSVGRLPTDGLTTVSP